MSEPTNRVRRCPQCNVENAEAAARCIVCGSDLAAVVPEAVPAEPVPTEPVPAEPVPAPTADREVAATGSTPRSSDQAPPTTQATTRAAATQATTQVTLTAPSERRSSRRLVGVLVLVVAIAASAGITFLLTGRSGDDTPASPIATAETSVHETSTASTATEVETTLPARPSTTLAITPDDVAERTTDAPPTVETTVPLGTVAPTVVTPPAPNPVPVVAGAFASSVRPDSEDGCGNPTNYAPELAIDGFIDTAWMTPGDGSGETLTIVLTGPSIVTELGLVPGYDKFDPCTDTDRFFELRRITSVLWTFDDGSEIEQTVDPSPAMWTITLNRAIVTSSVQMTILSTIAPGLARLDHTAVSEVLVA